MPHSAHVPSAPIARQDAGTDPYAWLQARDTPEVLAYLNAENAYQEAQLADQAALQGVQQHNLRGLTVGFPLQCWVTVTGVSGSGKSTLLGMMTRGDVSMRELRLIARQRQKLVGQLASEKNRLHKVLVDAGIRINVVVADIHGASARAMIKALIADKPMHEVLDCKGRLRARNGVSSSSEARNSSRRAGRVRIGVIGSLG